MIGSCCRRGRRRSQSEIKNYAALPDEVTHTNYDFMMGWTHLASTDNPMSSKEKVRTFYYDNASRPKNSVIVVTLRELQDAFLQKPESLQSSRLSLQPVSSQFHSTSIWSGGDGIYQISYIFLLRKFHPRPILHRLCFRGFAHGRMPPTRINTSS